MEGNKRKSGAKRGEKMRSRIFWRGSNYVPFRLRERLGRSSEYLPLHLSFFTCKSLKLQLKQLTVCQGWQLQELTQGVFERHGISLWPPAFQDETCNRFILSHSVCSCVVVCLCAYHLQGSLQVVTTFFSDSLTLRLYKARCVFVLMPFGAYIFYHGGGYACVCLCACC